MELLDIQNKTACALDRMWGLPNPAKHTHARARARTQMACVLAI